MSGNAVVVSYENMEAYDRLKDVAEQHGMSVEEYSKMVIDHSTAKYIKNKKEYEGIWDLMQKKK